MDRCAGCNAIASWCWLRSLGRCDWLSEEHWARHNAGRSAIGPGPVPEPPPPEPPSLAATLALRKRMLGCTNRTPISCGCGELATCALGRGTNGQVDHHDCRACLSEVD